MNTELLEKIVYGLLFGAAFVVFLLRVRRVTGGQTLTGSATVVSKRAERSKLSPKYSGGAKKSPTYYTEEWNHLATFRLSDGEELELFVGQSDYISLEPGQQGQLTWTGDTMGSFFCQKED